MGEGGDGGVRLKIKEQIGEERTKRQRLSRTSAQWEVMRRAEAAC